MSMFENMLQDIKEREKKLLSRPVTDGDLRRVTLDVDCLFRWSDKIVADQDEEGNVLEYTEGYIMTIVDNEMVYKGQPSIFLAQTIQEKAQATTSKDCPDCWGSGWETQFVTPCRACNGTGKKEV